MSLVILYFILKTPNLSFFFNYSSHQGFQIDLSCKQLTVDFVNQSVLQISSQDVEGKRSDKTDFAERLGAMNRCWQILQGLVTEKVRNKCRKFSHCAGKHEISGFVRTCAIHAAPVLQKMGQILRQKFTPNFQFNYTSLQLLQ